MNTLDVTRLLQNAGFNILGADSAYLYLEDPSCILRSFETFLQYAWVIITCITFLFLFGWAITLIRGAKSDYFTNIRNLIIMLGTVSAVLPIVNLIWGDDLFARGCRTIRVSFDELNKLMDMRNAKLSEYDEFNFYENWDIYDSGIVPYSEAPLATSDIPPVVETVSVSEDDNTYFPTPSQSVTGVAVSAAESGKDVIYTNPDGSKYKKMNGTRSWRNNNPGNIRYSEFTRRAGAIGQAGGFAVFPDEATGMRAITSLLNAKSYRNLTIAGAISRWAPPSENNTSAYHTNVQKLTGLSLNRFINDLTPTELDSLANAIRTVEGWQPGNIVEI